MPTSRPFPHIRPLSRSGFGLLELFAALAFLVIVLGLMVSLARHVRSSAADRLTRQVLRGLDQALSAGPPENRTVPDPPSSDGDEAAWAAFAVRSNAAVRRLLRSDEPITDAWGNPIALLPDGRRSIGVAPRDRPFCVSPGPDGRFLTRDDNLYSYEQLPQPAGAGGHGE